MIVRFGGGNSGIGKYLKSGNKSGRHYSRDELDYREPIHGDLELTEKLIDSIKNNNQERYIHITISFKENEIESEKISDATEYYMDMLMSAYKKEEYNYYAEIHRPKLKEIYNVKSGEMDERKPHVHIIIPSKNILTGGKLNPRGDYNKNCIFFEAMQEKTNIKYNFQTPKENIRESIKGKIEAIERYKGEWSRKPNTKNNILTEISKNIGTMSYNEFKSYLKERGEIKIRNEGKTNEYVAFKPIKSDKFINLRENIFRKGFFQNKSTKDEKSYNGIIKKWVKFSSLETKYLPSWGVKKRDEYFKMSDGEKRKFIKNHHENFYTGIKEIEESNRFAEEKNIDAKKLTDSERKKVISTRGKLHSESVVSLALTETNDRISMSIKKNTIKVNKVDAKEVVKLCAEMFNFRQKYSIGENNKIKVGNRQYSNTDFMTKVINLTWPETKEILENMILGRIAPQGHSRLDVIEKWKKFHSNEQNIIKDSKKEIKATKERHRLERINVIEGFKIDKKMVNSKNLSKEDKIFFNAVLVRNKMVKLDEINDSLNNEINKIRNGILPYSKQSYLNQGGGYSNVNGIEEEASKNIKIEPEASKSIKTEYGMD